MDLYFKADDKKRIWLILCTNLKVITRGKEKVVVNRSQSPIFKYLECPETKDKDEIIKKMKASTKGNKFSSGYKQVHCTLCLKNSKLYSIPIKVLFIWRKENTKDPLFRDLMLRVQGAQNLAKIEKLVKDTNWRETPVLTCEECFLNVTKEYKTNVSNC